MKCPKITSVLSCTVLLLGLFVASPICQAQGRLSDRDVKSMMKNLREDTKLFRRTFDDAIKKSVIRKTSQEKSATDLVAQFEQQADGMLKNFKQTQKSTTDVQNAVSTAKQIDKFVYGTQLNAKTISSWEKVRSELRQIANAYDVTENDSKSSDAVPLSR